LIRILLSVCVGILAQICALSWAYFEIQIEGDKSWARGLPCWRKKYSWYSKEITGYHVSLALFALSLVLLAFAILYLALISDSRLSGFVSEFMNSVLGMGSIALMISVGRLFAVFLSALALLTLFEDFLWVTLNPSPKFGVLGFTKSYPEVGETIWIWFMPIDYIAMASLSGFLAFLAGIFGEWLIAISIMFVVTLVLAARRYKIDVKTKLNSKGI